MQLVHGHGNVLCKVVLQHAVILKYERPLHIARKCPLPEHFVREMTADHATRGQQAAQPRCVCVQLLLREGGTKHSTLPLNALRRHALGSKLLQGG